MILWLLLFVHNTLADEIALERYCFESSMKMERVYQQVKPILLPSDKVMITPPCLAISMAPRRRELIQQYIVNLDPKVSVSFSSAEIKRDPCLLKVEKTHTLKKDSTELKVNETPELVATTTAAQGNETYQINTLKEFELSLNQDVVKGECRFITVDRYEISLEIRKDPKPLLPPTSPGTVVVVSPGQVPPHQETSKLQTTIQLTRGQKIELGGVLKDLKDRSRIVDASLGIEHQHNVGSTQERVFLSLE